jgi:hypothetical protein
MTAKSYHRAPDYKVTAFDGAVSNRHIVSSSDGRVWCVSGEALQLLRASEEGGTLGDIQQRLERGLGRQVDVARLQSAIDGQLVARGLVQVVGEEMQRPSRTSPVSMRVRLLSEPAVRRLARGLVWLMPEGPLFWAVLIPIVVLAFMTVGLAAGSTAGNASASIRLAAFALMVLSTVAHELGHATACTKAGARCGDIGFGMYWYFPVLFTRLDDVWRLDRHARARVDAAGLLFQCGFIALAALVAMLIPGGAAALGGMPVLLTIAVIYTLNPLLRFDGYWLLCDLTGVPNLRDASQQALRSVMGRAPSHADSAGGHSLLLGTRARAALAVYAAAAVVFATSLALIGVRLALRWIGAGAPARLRLLVTRIGSALSGGEISSALGAAIHAVELALPAVIATFLLIGSVRSTRAFARQVLT